MSSVSPSPRDLSLLKLLSWTPATTSLLFRASSTFEGEPFVDERRLRERLQALAAAKLVRSWATAFGCGGLQKYYKLTPMGFEFICGTEAMKPSRTFFTEISPSLVSHTFRLAECIVEIVRACHARRVTIEHFVRENELEFGVRDESAFPDCFFRLRAAGRPFNIAIEIDGSTESVDSHASNSIRRKLTLYDAYQDQVLLQWLAAGKTYERPRLRVLFLTPSVPRAYHILGLAADTSRHPSRRLVYAAPHDAFLTEPDPLFAPAVLDHLGHWQSLVNLHPEATYQRTPVRIAKPVESLLGVC